MQYSIIMLFIGFIFRYPALRFFPAGYFYLSAISISRNLAIVFFPQEQKEHLSMHFSRNGPTYGQAMPMGISYRGWSSATKFIAKLIYSKVNSFSFL